MNLLNIIKLKLFVLLIGVLLALVSAMAPAFAGTPIDKTVAATANGDVRIYSVAGGVKVTTWQRNKIHVGGTLNPAAKRLAVEKTAAGVTIRVVLPHNTSSHQGTRLVIQLPAASHLSVNTVSANISVRGLTGPVKLHTVSGAIALQSKSADISAGSVSGSIAVSGSTSNARVVTHTISGDVAIQGVGGQLSGESVSGDIALRASDPITRADLNTTSGGIAFTVALSSSGEYDFHSVSGDVKLRLPSIPSASFDASSLSGDITTNFGPAPQRTSEYGPGTEWHYQSGSGKAEVRIHTMSGDIRIHASNHS